MDTCRRQVLLRYFGEHLAEPCGNCDACLHPAETFDGTVAAQKVLSCVARTGQRFGAVYLIDVLRGRANERIRRLRHDQLPTFGVGAEFDEWQWRSVIRQLVARGLLQVDRAGYGGLQLTKQAVPVLLGGTQVMLRRDLLSEPESEGPRKRKKTRKVLLTAADDSGQPVDQDLYEVLRDLRRDIAKEQGVPAYVIFHDKTLAAMAAHRPTSEEHLLRISGVGEAKLERYGERFLAAIREADQG